MNFITAAVLERFLAYAEDANNWSGCPLVGGNVGGDPADKGLIVNMKKAGLVTTWKQRASHRGEPATVWMDFTAAGRELAAKHDIELCIYE